jgi:hypothetical protein
MSSSLDHWHLKERRPKQSPYTEAFGMNLNMITQQEDRTSGSYDPTYMSLMETVSPQKMNKLQNILKNHQMKSHRPHNQHQKNLATRNPHNASHL